MNLSKAGRQVRVRTEKSRATKAKLRRCRCGLPCSPVFPLARPRPVLAGILGIGDETGSQERELMSKLKTRESQKLEVKGWERK